MEELESNNIVLNRNVMHGLISEEKKKRKQLKNWRAIKLFLIEMSFPMKFKKALPTFNTYWLPLEEIKGKAKFLIRSS